MFTWYSPDPYLTLISSFHFKIFFFCCVDLIGQPITNPISGCQVSGSSLRFTLSLTICWQALGQVPVQSPSPKSIKKRERGNFGLRVVTKILWAKSRWVARGRTQGSSPCSSRTLSKKFQDDKPKFKIPRLVPVDYESGYGQESKLSILIIIRKSLQANKAKLSA